MGRAHPSRDLVEEIEGEDPDAPHDARRRYYRLTERGRRAAEEEVEFLARLTRAASGAGLARRRRYVSDLRPVAVTPTCSSGAPTTR